LNTKSARFLERKAKSKFCEQASPSPAIVVLEVCSLYNGSVKGKNALLLPLLLVLTACGQQKVSAPETAPSVSGGKSAVVVLSTLATNPSSPHPSGTMGIFSSLYLAQGVFLPTHSAVEGVNVLLTILRQQEKPLTDETLLLLEQLSSAMDVNILDALNRSNDRVETLDRYIEALTNLSDNATKKLQELKVYRDNIQDQHKVQRDTVRLLERAIKDATNAKDYATASEKQSVLMKEQNILSGLELKDKQTRDAIDQYQKLTESAGKRLKALGIHREILLSGLTITDTQGLEDLGIMKTDPKKKKSSLTW